MLVVGACMSSELGLFSFLGVQIMVTSHLFPIMLHVGWSVSSQHIGCVYILVGLASLILLLLVSVTVHRWLSRRRRELSTPSGPSFNSTLPAEYVLFGINLNFAFPTLFYDFLCFLSTEAVYSSLSCEYFQILLLWQ